MLKFACVGNSNEMFFSNFLIDNKFELMNIKDLLKIDENRMIVVDYKTPSSKLKEIAGSLNYKKSIITIFLLPKTRKEIKFKDHIVCIFYPIKIDDFKKTLIKKMNVPKISFKEISLDKRGFIINKKNNLKTYLTETEQDI